MITLKNYPNIILLQFIDQGCYICPCHSTSGQLSLLMCSQLFLRCIRSVLHSYLPLNRHGPKLFRLVVSGLMTDIKSGYYPFEHCLITLLNMTVDNLQICVPQKALLLSGSTLMLGMIVLQSLVLLPVNSQCEILRPLVQIRLILVMYTLRV